MKGAAPPSSSGSPSGPIQPSGHPAQPGDPGARLLLKIGNFLEPLTRFDRSHLTMSESRHETVSVAARQSFRIAFEVKHAEGNGPLPAGVESMADREALARGIEDQLQATRASAPSRLAAWAEAHGEDALARPGLADCFASMQPLGFVEDCAVCVGQGHVACVYCKGSAQVTCESCKGRGASNCEACEARGSVTCQTCKGAGTVTEQTQRKVHDDVIGQDRIEHVQEELPCPVCDRTGAVTCRRCEGQGERPCLTCEGRKTLPCQRCAGSGTQTCSACAGHGKRHRVSELACTIKETFESAPRHPETEIVDVLRRQGSIDHLLMLAAEHHSTAETNGHTLSRETHVSVPVTSVTVSAGEGYSTLIRGYGPGQDVTNYRNLAGVLLVDDLVQLDGAIAMTQLIPPTVNDAIYDSLGAVLASEANFIIAMSPADKTPIEIERDFKGVITAEYIKRAAAAIPTAIRRTYWAGLARGPGWLLAIPLVYAPLDLLLRGSGMGTRVVVLLVVMLATFGAGVLGHASVVRMMQMKIAPTGKPRIASLVDRLGLTRAWLIAAGATAGLLSLLVAGLTTWAFPAT